MWVMKVKIDGSKSLMGSKTSKFQIDLFLFPLSFVKQKRKFVVHAAGTIFGSEKNIKEFVKELKTEKRVINVEVNGDFFVCTIEEPTCLDCVYNERIIHVEPTHISSKGYEVGCLGSFARSNLTNAISVLERKYDGKIISIQNRKIKSISIMRVHPNLTDKQREAMKLAIKGGYYDYPRKIDLQKLARLSKLSFSTYQAHLRKAEGKLIPHYFE